MELLIAAFSSPNLIITLLFLLILFYWISVILGALNVDSFDIDVDVDAHVDVHTDVHTDVHADTHGHGHGAMHGSSWFFGMLRFFNFGRVPFMVVMSILILSMWAISMACNHEGSWVNPTNSFLIASLYFIPNVIISAFVMKFLSTPLIPIFDKLDTHEQNLHYEGQTGTLTTGISESGLGQVKLQINNSNIIVSVKSLDGKPIPKGQKVVILEETEEGKCYIVAPADQLS